MTILIRNKVSLFLLIFCGILINACSSERVSENSRIEFKITELNDSEYPDNPDIGFRHRNYNANAFKNGYLVENDASYSFVFMLAGGDSITISELDVMQFIPETPKHLQKDHYLNKLALINQEWNRNQVKLLPGEFTCGDSKVVRVDIARNCLNSYLWEVILYEKDGDQILPYAHGWFNFPKKTYRELFNKRNNSAFDPLKGHLVNWHDPESRFVNKALLRKYVDEWNITYTDESDSMYPLMAAREKKRKEIIWPESFSSMRELQSDSTVFATFSPPGFYNKKDPRPTELGRFKHLNGLHVYNTKSIRSDSELIEIEFNFDDPNSGLMTRLFIGGLKWTDFPQLSEVNANKGWKNSMGFGNHSFYESLKDFNHYNTAESDYYAYLTDANGNWLDSHKIGIDGPIIHIDENDPNLLHVWLLSFERHALIGHYLIQKND
ncbi:hypothetical protein N9355_08545 [Crocinitomicaceae bacterium]|nr:hypothetical protein [Crocinitomicaceae bacterium]